MSLRNENLTERNGNSRGALNALQSRGKSIVMRLQLQKMRQARPEEAFGSLGEDENTNIPTQTNNNEIAATGGDGSQKTSFNSFLASAAAKMPLKREYRSRDDTNAKKPSDWIQRTCVAPNCSKRQKSGVYYRKPGTADGDDQEYFCFTCWSKDHVANANRMCFICDRTHAGGCWYKSKLHGGKDLCTRCYERERRERLQSSGTVKCWCCGATRSSGKWRTSKDESEGKKDLCNKCYVKECRATKRAVAAETRCVVCEGQITTAWKKTETGGDICEQCHRREPAQ